MADEREWFALIVRELTSTSDRDPSLDEWLVALLDDYDVCGISHLEPMPLPPGGIWDLSFPPPPDPPAAPLAWRIFFRTADDRDHARQAIAARFPALELSDEAVHDENWAARSQHGLRAITAGAFTIAPPWDVPRDAANLIIVEPSRGFGTGHHPSTRLCLRAISDVAIDGRSVVDLGTGSGVLAMAAALAGARDVTAIDIDPDAVDAAKESVALNRLPITIDFLVGDFRTGALGGQQYGVVLANLTGGMLVGAARAIMRLVAANGTLIASGFDEDERAAVEAALSGLAVRAIYTELGWVGLTLQSA